MAPVELRISFDKSSKQYHPGEVVSGNVIIHLDRIMSVTTVSVRVLGQGWLQWSNNIKCLNSFISSEHSNYEKFLDDRKTIWESQNYEALGKGKHEFPFSIQLPEKLPESFELDRKWKGIASIKYVCIATLKNSENITMFSSKCKTESKFTIKGFLAIPPAEEDNTTLAADQSHSIFCCCEICCCWPSGKVHGSVTTDKRACAPGDVLEISGEISNDSRSTLTHVRVAILQKVTLVPGRGKSHCLESQVANLDCPQFAPIRPGGQLRLRNVALTVPSVAATNLGASKTILVQYKAGVILGRGFGFCSPKVQFDIPITIHTLTVSDPGSENVPQSPTSIITSQPRTLS